MNINIIKQKIKDAILQLRECIIELLQLNVKGSRGAGRVVSPSTGSKVMTKTSNTANKRYYNLDGFANPHEPNYINSPFAGSKKNKRKGKSRKKVTHEQTINKKIKRV